MVTTVLVLEILVMGTLALGWLSLLSLRLGLIEPSLLTWLMGQSTPWQVFSAAIALVAVYQLGSILNTITYAIFEKLRGRQIKRVIFADIYEEARGVVFQHGSSHFLQDLDYQLRFIRLARSGVINFIMLGICAVSFGEQYRGLGILSIILGVICYPAWGTIYRFYYQGIYSVFRAIQDGHRSDEEDSTTAKAGEVSPNLKHRGAPNPGPQADG